MTRCILILALAALLAACGDEPAVHTPFADEELTEPIGSPGPEHDTNPCAGRDMDGPVVIEGPEDGWQVGPSFIVYGCASGPQVDWRLLVGGQPVATGSENTWDEGHPSYFEFIVQLDPGYIGESATLQVMGGEDTPPAAVEVRLVEPIGEVILPDEGP